MGTGTTSSATFHARSGSTFAASRLLALAVALLAMVATLVFARDAQAQVSTGDLPRSCSFENGSMDVVFNAIWTNADLEATGTCMLGGLTDPLNATKTAAEIDLHGELDFVACGVPSPRPPAGTLTLPQLGQSLRVELDFEPKSAQLGSTSVTEEQGDGTTPVVIRSDGGRALGVITLTEPDTYWSELCHTNWPDVSFELSWQVSLPCSATAGAGVGDVLTDVGVGVTVPPVGKGVTGFVTTVYGSQVLAVDHNSDGSLTVSGCGSEAPVVGNPTDYLPPAPVPPALQPIGGGGGGADPPPDPNNDPPPAGSDPQRDPVEDRHAGAPKACSDGAWKPHPQDHKWTSIFEWRLNRDTIPSYLGQGAAESAIRDATSAITNANNNCGFGDGVSATQQFAGGTSKHAKMDDIVCGNADDVSVAEFGGNLPDIYVAATCVWDTADSGRDTAYESDVRFNKQDFEFSTDQGSCSHEFDLKGAATHERGLTFGLGELDEQKHGNLTMSDGVTPCDRSPYTLGLGDIRGLEDLY